jgi:thymidylate synthase
MQNYHNLMQEILNHGIESDDRTGTGTLSLFGRQLRYDLQKGFPAITTKELHFHSVKGELLWFLMGSTNTKWLNEQGITIWDEWQDSAGSLGPIYGKQWRDWEECAFGHYDDLCNGPCDISIDQIANVIENIESNPGSRRHIVSAWNVSDIQEMALPPCHLLFQFYVRKGRLSCMMTQRSCDLLLGLPFNIASYALLTHMIAQVTNLDAHELIISLGDVHIYKNHVQAVKTQLRRDHFHAPTLWLNPSIKCIDDFTMDDIRLDDYVCHPKINAEIAV